MRINSESAAALYPVDPPSDTSALFSEIEGIRQRVAGRLHGMTVSAALGHLYPKVLDAHRAFREAEQVARRLQATTSPEVDEIVPEKRD